MSKTRTDIKKLFQVVPPCGGHPISELKPDEEPEVSSRAPVWGASPPYCSGGTTARVSSRAPVWGASGPSSAWPGIRICFKSCPRVGGIFALRCPGWRFVRFKSCPRVGGIEPGGVFGRRYSVSSRAPVWGASFPLILSRVVLSVSSRAPVWGASEDENL